MPLDQDEVDMIINFANKLNWERQSMGSVVSFIIRELGCDKDQALEYAFPLIKLINGPRPEDKPTDPFLKDRFSGYNYSLSKTALKPMSPNKGPRKPPGYHQLHDDMNVSPYCSCGICGSGVDCKAGACPNCSADSTSFVQGDPKTQRDKKNPTAPQQVRNVPLMAAVLENKEKDDKEPFDKKLEPWKESIGGPKTVKDMLNDEEKEFSDPDDPKNSDKNHMESVEDTWAALSGE